MCQVIFSPAFLQQITEYMEGTIGYVPYQSGDYLFFTNYVKDDPRLMLDLQTGAVKLLRWNDEEEAERYVAATHVARFEHSLANWKALLSLTGMSQTD